MTIKIPTWAEAAEAVRHGQATALDRFIYNNEPAGNDDESKFRDEVAELAIGLTEPLKARVKEFIDAVEKQAFNMRAPNAQTPVLIQLCNSARALILR